jgi:hypothetical protein
MAIGTSRRARRLALTALVLALAPAGLAAQATSTDLSASRPLRVTALTGGIAHRSALIVDPLGGGDTRLGPGPTFGLELQYSVFRLASLYVGAAGSFSTLEHGTNLGVVARGAASDATLILGTAGVMLEASEDWAGDLRPTLRLGGGLKRYSFTTPGSSSYATGTGDFGVGFRGGTGPIEISGEVRYLPSVFDQGKLPLRGITPQNQRQNDLLFVVGVTVRQ